MAELVNEEMTWLVELVAGDYKAFRVIYDRYHAKLYDFAMWLSKDRYETEELVQSTFVMIWENRQSIDPGQPFGNYLFTITRNRFYDMLRKKNTEKYYIDYILQHETQESDDVQTQMEEAELQQIIDKLLQKIPERRLLIFRLSRDENLSYKQIASKLNISENTVDTQIRNVLNYLRKELPKYYK